MGGLRHDEVGCARRAGGSCRAVTACPGRRRAQSPHRNAGAGLCAVRGSVQAGHCGARLAPKGRGRGPAALGEGANHARLLCHTWGSARRERPGAAKSAQKDDPDVPPRQECRKQGRPRALPARSGPHACTVVCAGLRACVMHLPPGLWPRDGHCLLC